MYAAAPMLIPGKRIGVQSEKIGSQIVVAVWMPPVMGEALGSALDRRQFHAADPFLGWP